MSGKRGPKIKLTDSGRKRRKQERNAIVNKSRISIGDQIDRWNDIKTQLSIESNAEVAKILLDRYVYSKSFFTYNINYFLLHC